LERQVDALWADWLTAEQGKRLLLTVDGASFRCKRECATLAILLGYGLRRTELTAMRVEDFQQKREVVCQSS